MVGSTSNYKACRANFSPYKLFVHSIIRWDNQNMRWWWWLGQTNQLFFSYKQSLKFTRRVGWPWLSSREGFSPYKRSVKGPKVIFTLSCITYRADTKSYSVHCEQQRNRTVTSYTWTSRSHKSNIVPERLAVHSVSQSVTHSVLNPEYLLPFQWVPDLTLVIHFRKGPICSH